jgi:hypothetical protein
MFMFKRIARLFTIKTRLEAFLVTYAIAVGAVERGQHYMHQYPGNFGIVLALCCSGVVFLAGGKLLDSVRPMAVMAVPLIPAPSRARRSVSRSRPRFRRRAAAATSASLFRKD